MCRRLRGKFIDFCLPLCRTALQLPILALSSAGKRTQLIVRPQWPSCLAAGDLALLDRLTRHTISVR